MPAMRRPVLIAIIALLAFGGTYILKANLDHEPPSPKKGPQTQERIVSMKPSITEILFALELGDNVVGVTRFCNFPEPAQDLPKIGGFYDPNYEAIVALEPDLVILSESHEEHRKNFNRLNIDYLTVPNQDTLAEIRESILDIGRATGAHAKAQDIVNDMDARLEAVAQRTAGLPTPTVLIVVSRDIAAQDLNQTYVAGPGTFYDDLLEIAGGRNAMADTTAQYPTVSIEGILRTDPDVILEILPDLQNRDYTENEIMAAWRKLPELNAVQEDRIHTLSGNYVAVPGPRVTLLVEDMAERLHPEIDWSAS